MNNEDISFVNFIKKYDIKIPIIQRDYVQGRKNAEDIRENFVEAIFDSLQSCEELNLEFIYGNIYSRFSLFSSYPVVSHISVFYFQSPDSSGEGCLRRAIFSHASFLQKYFSRLVRLSFRLVRVYLVGMFRGIYQNQNLIVFDFYDSV